MTPPHPPHPSPLTTYLTPSRCPFPSTLHCNCSPAPTATLTPALFGSARSHFGHNRTCALRPPLPNPLRHLRPAPPFANLAELAKRLIARALAPCTQGEPPLAQVLRRSRLSLVRQLPRATPAGHALSLCDGSCNGDATVEPQYDETSDKKYSCILTGAHYNYSLANFNVYYLFVIIRCRNHLNSDSHCAHQRGAC